MKKIKVGMVGLGLLISAGALLLGACSDATLTKVTNFTNSYSHLLDNFDAASKAVDVNVIARTSPELAKYCGVVVEGGKKLTGFVDKSPAARTGLGTATAALTAYCENLPSDIPSAIKATIDAASAAKDAYDKARAGG